MKLRNRWRRIAMWAGMAACAAFPFLTLLSFFGGLRFNFGDPKWSFLMCATRVGAIWIHDSYEFNITSVLNGDHRFFDVKVFRWRGDVDRLKLLYEEGVMGKLQRHELVIPLWIPFLLFAIPTFFLWRSERRDRRRAAAGACGGCGYDLTGNVTGRCPECGTAAEPAAGSKLPS